MQVFNYNFNINGNFSQSITQMAQQTDAFTQKAQGACAWCEKWAGRLAKLNLASDYVQQLSATFRNFGQANVELDSQMHDLSAVAGVTGEGLKTIENYARESAKTFGSDAGTAVQGYKLLLSQLTPELGKCPQALKAMGDAIQTTSKLMGGDGTAAAEVLTTAMNQYGVSLADPMEASRKMAEMMNTMAAAGQAGSAELPAIKAALEQCGMAAKAANVSFEETNAAIQVLDKAGKKGSEGGVALRNTLSILSQGRFLPKDTREELEKAGIDVIALGDKSKSLKERLEMLKPILSDSALFSKLFGMENANAARALVQGTDLLAHFTEAVTGTNSAVEQAGVIMESAAEKKARFRQKIEDLKISFAQLTGGVSSYIGIMAGMLVPVSQLMPLILGAGKAIKFVVTLNYTSYLGRIDRAILYSASVLSKCCNTLSGLFRQIIEDRTDILYPVKDLEVHRGLGFSAWCDNNRILIGTRAYMEKEEVPLPDEEYEAKHSKNGELQILYLAVSGSLHAMFVLHYVGGRNAARGLEQLQKENIQLLVSCQDPTLTARHITDAYHLPEGMVVLLDQEQCAALGAATAEDTGSEGCCILCTNGFASLTGGLRAAEQAQNAETTATTVQLVSVWFSVAIAVLLTYAGSVGMLSVAAVLMYQAAWSALSIAVCALKQHS